MDPEQTAPIWLLKHFSRREKQTTFVAVGALRVKKKCTQKFLISSSLRKQFHSTEHGLQSWNKENKFLTSYPEALVQIQNLYRKARIFLLVDLREFFFRFRVGGTKKNE